MWTYRIATGTLLHDGTFEGTGYSGAGFPTEGYRNNPDMTSVIAKGPIPQGKYIIGSAYNHPRLGPCVMPLTPELDTNTRGRSGFFIHGDNARHDASHGCIILGPALRHLIDNDRDGLLEVV